MSEQHSFASWQLSSNSLKTGALVGARVVASVGAGVVALVGAGIVALDRAGVVGWSPFVYNIMWGEGAKK